MHESFVWHQKGQKCKHVALHLGLLTSAVINFRRNKKIEREKDDKKNGARNDKWFDTFYVMVNKIYRN